MTIIMLRRVIGYKKGLASYEAVGRPAYLGLNDLLERLAEMGVGVLCSLKHNCLCLCNI